MRHSLLSVAVQHKACLPQILERIVEVILIIFLKIEVLILQSGCVRSSL